jgi:urease accessory protein UreF
MEQVLHQIRFSSAVTTDSPSAVADLLEQLGSMEDLVSITAAGALLQNAPITSVQALAVFIETYLEQVLIPIELPAIYQASFHASQNHCRELVALDRSVADQLTLPQFSAASRQVGQLQLRRLRPIRGDRTLQRYLSAVDQGEATGWHTVVYGITLALYSLPARQGLMHYAYRTMAGFVRAAARSLHLTESDCREIVEDLCADLPQAIESTLARPIAVL